MKKDKTIDTLVEKRKHQGIINIYKSWFAYSCQHDYPAMTKLCIEGSGFAELTNACARSLKLGIFYCYELLNIAVVQINTESAVVKGQIKLIQSGQKLVFSGTFQSGCRYSDSAWKLDDIGIEWDL